jgi:protein tyrosine phosphatase (PTP) superfamily phosphohydrolase (DUF442 family)
MPDSPVVPLPRPSLGRVLVSGALIGLTLALMGHLVYVMIGPNFHTLVPGAVYRSAQPSGPGLEKLIRKLGIRTVINLRGCCDPLPWYLAEAQVANRFNISLEDVSMSANRLPSVPVVRQLIEILERSEYPILFHCHKGADRTGLVSTLTLLLRSDTSLAEARKQLGLRFGHLSIGKTSNIDRFFDLYAEWLAEHGREHSRAVFRHWAWNEYCPGEGRCRIEVLDTPGPVLHAPLGRPFPIHIRCWNTSVKPWQLRPATSAGIHASFLLGTPAGQVVKEGRSGLFRATVPPGDHIDLTLSLPPLHQRGRYTLRIDMVDEQHAYFLQLGSEPLFREVEVP